jgi:hypothetical protein
VLAAANFGQNTVLLNLPIESTQQGLETLTGTKLYVSHVKTMHFTPVSELCQSGKQCFLTNTSKNANNMASGK